MSNALDQNPNFTLNHYFCENGEYYNYDVTGNYVDYDASYIDWEVDDGYVDDFLYQRIDDQDREDLIDDVELVNK